MNRILLYFLFSIISFTGFSQKVYFIYLQTENDQTFYVRMDQTLYSSSPSGYLIIPKLKDSTYVFSVGFPQNKWPEQKFSVVLNKKDHGYLVKNFADKGWGLYDLQTLSIQMATGGSAYNPTRPSDNIKDISPFTDILAKAADDPSIKESQAITIIPEKGTGTAMKEQEKTPELSPEKNAVTTVEKNDAILSKTTVSSKETNKKTGKKPDEKKVADKKPVEKKPGEKTEPVVVKTEIPSTENKELTDQKPDEIKESVAVKTEEPKTATNKPGEKELIETIAPEQVVYKPSVIVKRSESSTTEGMGIVFIDQDSKGAIDTISVLIPNPKPVVTPKETPLKEEKKFIEILQDSVAVMETKPEEIQEEKLVYYEMNNCPSLAKENDFFKLRKLMAAAEGDDNMINEAKEYYKVKCFSTIQVKNLGTLFLDDKGRYRFFMISYNHVSDKKNFGSLQAELKDETFSSRFKAIVRN